MKVSHAICTYIIIHKIQHNITYGILPQKTHETDIHKFLMIYLISFSLVT